MATMRLFLRRFLCLLTLGIAASVMAQTPTDIPQREIAVAPSAFTRNATLPPWFKAATRLPATSARDPIIMRLADTHFRVESSPREIYHRAIQVNESSNLSEIGQYTIGFQPDYQHVELHRLRVHRAGEIIDKMERHSTRFYHAERSASQGIYTGSVTAVVIPQDIRVGDTLEIIFSVVGQNPVFAGRFTSAAGWETNMPVLRRIVTLDSPKDRRIRHLLVGSTNPVAPVEIDASDRHLVRYEAENLPAFLPEALMPPDVQAPSWVQFSEFGDWREVSQWAVGLFSGVQATDFVMPELGKSSSKADVVMRALEYVQNNIRYLSISIGENSHRPYSPSEVLARGYGDCKDKTQLLVAMLRRLGIDAQPVLVSVQIRSGLGALIPSPALFDHVVVRATVDGKTYFLDPTMQNQSSRLEHLVFHLPSAEGLVVQRGVTTLNTIPPQHFDSGPSAHRFEKVTVQRMDQPVDMQVEIQFRAEDADGFRRYFSSISPAQLKKAYEGMLDRRYPQAQITSDPQIIDNRETNQLTVRVSYRVPNFFERQEGRWSMRYEASNLNDSVPLPNNAKRTFPLYFGAYLWTASYQMEVNLPDDYDANYKPERRSLQGEAFKLDEWLNFKGRKLGVEVKLELVRDRIAANRTPQYLEDLRQANAYFRGSLFIDDRQMRAAPVALVALKELSRQRLDLALRNSATAIDAAKNRGGESAGARCEHALASAYLDQGAIALVNANAAVTEQPTSPDILRCRGTVRFILGDFDNSIRDLSRALSLGQDEAETYFQRGLAHYYAGQWRKAEEDFGTYATKSNEPQLKARAAVWQALAKQRSGTTAPQRDPYNTAWPSAAIAVFNNQASAEDVIEQLNQSERGIRLEEATAEAYFYFFQHFATSNRAKARAYLRRSLDLGALHSLVQVAARHEMNRLDSTGRSPAGR
jgi:tetratricopeptide (TPR) repeat protein